MLIEILNQKICYLMSKRIWKLSILDWVILSNKTKSWSQHVDHLVTQLRNLLKVLNTSVQKLTSGVLASFCIVLFAAICLSKIRTLNHFIRKFFRQIINLLVIFPKEYKTWLTAFLSLNQNSDMDLNKLSKINGTSSTSQKFPSIQEISMDLIRSMFIKNCWGKWRKPMNLSTLVMQDAVLRAI